jgi:hypothetical protein
VTVRIYAEGAGEGELYDTLFRHAWQAFFRAAGLAGRMPAVIRGKSRERTFDLFRTAIQNPPAGVLPLLLVDSEGPVPSNATAWQHLRTLDGWEKPDLARDDQAFLMVQLMETWFLADSATLRRYFGAQLRESAFRAWPDLESVPKQTVLNALSQATAECRKPYAKGRVSFDLLAQIDPALVETSCPRARLLLDRLRQL